MAIDPYAPCPCGSGKKLKFCCADLAGDIEKIHTQIASDQPRAALQRIERLLAKHPRRASLLDLKASLQLSLHEFDDAATTIKCFLDAHPETPVSHAQTAILLAAKEHPIEAIAKVQDALERIEHDMPLRVLESIGAVGNQLLLSGNIVAARAHLLLYSALSEDEDNPALELLVRLNLQGGLPLMLRESQPLVDLAEDFPQKAAFEEAKRTAEKGLWRRAESQFAQLADGNEPAVVYNLALIRGWLGDAAGMAGGLRSFAQLDVPRDDAIEAEALAQLIDPPAGDPTIESLRLSYGVAEEDRLIERFENDPRVDRYELDPDSLGQLEGPPPRAAYILLDRPLQHSSEGLQLDSVPQVLAFMSVYGKRTDREAQLEVTADRDDAWEEASGLLREIGGESLGAEQECTVIGEKSHAESALGWRWRLPDGTPMSHRLTLLRQRRRRALLEDWTAAAQAALRGKSPRDAAGDPDLKIRLAAIVLLLEQSAADIDELEIFRELREELDLPADDLIDPTDVDLSKVSLVQLSRLDRSQMSDEQLADAFKRTAMCGADLASRCFAEELVGRKTSSDVKGAAYRQLILRERDPDRASEWVKQAKEWAESRDSPTGEWAVLELELAIERRDVARIQQVLDQIRTDHLHEPGVSDATYRLLHQAGLVHPQSSPDGPVPEPLGAPSPTERKSPLWTPESDVPAREDGGQSAIWTP